MRCGCLLLNPPPSPALPVEGRESEGHEIGSLMTTHERLHPLHVGVVAEGGASKGGSAN